MKTKTDLYTKIMLTAVVALLAAHLVKDLNFVERANAAPRPAATINEAMHTTIENITDNEVLLIFDNKALSWPYDGSGSGNISSFDKAQYVIVKGRK